MNKVITPQQAAVSPLENILVGILVVYCYYQGLVKVIAFDGYQFWVSHSPLIKKTAVLVAYGVPVLLFVIAGLLLISTARQTALYLLIFSQLLLFSWVAYVVYATPFLFGPWRAPWANPNWFQKLMEALLIAWLALWCLRLPQRNE